MGNNRGRGKRTMKRDFRKGKQEQQQEPGEDTRKPWAPIVMENAAFEEYYKAQGICPENEWDEFMATLRKPLPLTFRINGSGRFAHELRRKLETDFFSGFAEGPIIIDDEEIQPPTPLPWYPKNLAWQMEFSRNQLRKVELLKNLHEFMKRENGIGSITRQEAVSMVPPLFLDVQPHHRVLDMCAAPGSKTYQLLEAIHANDDDPTGLVIANDADVQRCNMLTHQAQRFRSPALIVTNHEGQAFPRLFDINPSSEDTYVMFDRILADVPCSGDGTLRKAPDLWTRWATAYGNGFHLLQLQIALRACELLRVGGRVVYSTCTFNPLEDEAVVAEVLRRTKGSMTLLDMSGHLPELKRRPGIKTWRVRDKQGWYNSWEEGKKGYKLYESMFPKDDDLPLERCMRFLPHDQNTGGFFVAVLEKVSELVDLEYPTASSSSSWVEGNNNDKNKGRKRKTHPDEGDGNDAAEKKEGGNGDGGEEATEQQQQPVVEESKAVAVKQRAQPPPKVLPAWGSKPRRDPPPAKPGRQPRLNAGRWNGVDIIIEYNNQEEINKIIKFYGFSDDCPIPQALIARTRDERPRKLNYVGPGAKLIAQMNTNEMLKIPFLGLKLFEKQDRKDAEMECSYRVSQDGLPCILPYITRQIFRPTLKEFIALLKDRSLALPESCKMFDHAPAQPAEGDGDKGDGDKGDGDGEAAVEKKANNKLVIEDEDTISKVKDIGLGCCIATMREEDLQRLGLRDGTGEGALMANAPFALSCWRGRGTVNALVGRAECDQMLERLVAAEQALAADGGGGEKA